MLIVALALLPVLALIGGGLSERLSVGGFTDPTAESSIVADRLEQDFSTGTYGFVLLLQPKDKWVYSEGNTIEGERLTVALEQEPGVVEVASYYNITGPPSPAISPLQDFRGDRALIGVNLGGDENEQRRTAARLHETYVGPNPIFDISATGVVEVSRAAAEQAESDLARAELLAAPFTLLGLLLVFRGLRASLVPIAVAVFAVLGSFVALSFVIVFTEISVFARTLVTALGLGLAVDYSLLLVARFREERAGGRTVEAAVSRTMQTAGRTVFFSAATVGSSLLGLLAFRVVYLRSFAFAGVAVVATAALATLVLIPPILIRWGDKFGQKAPTEQSFWGRQARRVTRAPILWLIPSVLFLLLLASPFLNLSPGRVDDRVLPVDADARVAADEIRNNMTWAEVNPILILAPEVDPADAESVRAISNEFLAFDGMVRVDSALGFLRVDSFTPPNELTPHFYPNPESDTDADSAGTWFSLVHRYDPDDPRVDDLITTLRNHDSSAGELLIGGNNATVNDTVDSVVGRLPIALAIVAVFTLVLLFFMTGSVLVPIKAIVLNLLSLSATFGALVWVFQDGHLGGLSGVTTTGEIDVFTPILMFCVAFGLSMDYEVFLLARIKEEYDLSGNNDQAIHLGMGRTGPIVTAAALLLAIVFIAIATSQVAIVRMFGVGLALAVLTDAFLVRATITPAIMKLAGRANWWAPRWARLLHLRWGLWENDPIDIDSADLGMT